MATFEDFSRSVRIKSGLTRELLCEFFCTALLVCLGCATCVQFQIMKSIGNDATILTVYLGWAGAVCLCITVGNGVSGAHMNPALTLAMATLGKLSWTKVIPYMAVQYFGAFSGSIVPFYIYKDALEKIVTDRSIATAGMWATYPQEYLSIGNAFADQVFGTALLLIFVLGITDERSMGMPKYLVGPMVGLFIMTIGFSYGINCGYAINPARDLGPRFFSYIAGWGPDVFTAFEAFSWVPLIAPHIGAVLGAWVYMFFIGFHWPDQNELGLNDNIEIQPLSFGSLNGKQYKNNHV